MLRRSSELLLALWLLTALSAGQASAGPGQQGDGKVPAVQSSARGQVGKHLVRVETITASAETASGFSTPLRCDYDGNLYYRANHVDAIHKLNLKGDQVAMFQATAHADKQIDGAGFFALAADGDLYELVFPHEFTRYVYVYKSDGSFKSSIKLNPGFTFMPHALAVFPSGQLLVAGSEYDRDHAAAMWPFTGIFAADGGLLKEIKLEDDETLRDMAVAGDARVRSPAPMGSHGNMAIDLSQVEMAADGNAYLMRWTNPAIIYAISAGGEVVRRLKVDPAGSRYSADTMHVFRNRIAVLFVDWQTHDKLIKIVDLEGREIDAYDELRTNGKPAGEMLGSAFTCYTEDPTRLVFLGSNDNHALQFWIAEPR